MHIAPGELYRTLHGGEALLTHSPLGDCPALLLALEEADNGEREALATLLPELPCPVIGIGDAADSLAAACDTLVDSADAAAPLLKNARRAPFAAMTLVQVLRLTPRLPPAQALTVESLAYATLQNGAEYHRWLSREQHPVTQPAEDSPAVLLQREQDTLSIELNRPAQRNEISVEVRDALIEALQLVVADDSITRVQLRGAGKCFSVGGALHEFGTTADSALSHALRSVQLPARWLLRCAERVEAHVHGACIGAGVEIPAFAGRVVARPGTFFHLPELSMGLIPGAGGCVSLPRRIGRQRAVWMALSGRRINARTALEWGLVDEIAAD